MCYKVVWVTGYRNLLKIVIIYKYSYLVILKRRLKFMGNIKNNTAKIITKTLNKVLSAEANSNSCILAYQPKVPKDLKKFKK